MCCGCFTRNALKTNGRWSDDERLVFLYIVTFVYLSGCDHLCLLFFLSFSSFFCRRWLSALCLNLNLDRMYSFHLQWKWTNDKIRMVKKNWSCLYLHFCVEKKHFTRFRLVVQWKQCRTKNVDDHFCENCYESLNSLMNFFWTASEYLWAEARTRLKTIITSYRQNMKCCLIQYFQQNKHVLFFKKNIYSINQIYQKEKYYS